MFKNPTLPISDEYRSPLQLALLLQVPIAILCLLMLDGGGLAKLCAIAMIAFWCGAAMILVRRPGGPSFLDKLYLKFGFMPLFVVVCLVHAFRASS